ncbi:hypothetical protein ZIOFF_005153 [Zingiber officinale]|uniref:Uncharacterized protein n=1 Tax=Zingiber officinale TaxID=94328 RepID=A0A8J5HM10_ZINOF|nr:hypothetical protein ZIOFF_005153 [Zingiber officinale]
MSKRIHHFDFHGRLTRSRSSAIPALSISHLVSRSPSQRVLVGPTRNRLLHIFGDARIQLQRATHSVQHNPDVLEDAKERMANVVEVVEEEGFSLGVNLGLHVSYHIANLFCKKELLRRVDATITRT